MDNTANITTFEAWCAEQEIEYEVVVSVNHVDVVDLRTDDSAEAMRAARGAKSKVNAELREQFAEFIRGELEDV